MADLESDSSREPLGGWRGLVDDLDAVIWEADPSTFGFTFVSRGATRVLGYSPEECLASPDFWVQILHPEDRSGAVEFCQNRVAAGLDHSFEYRVIHRDGHTVWLHDLVRVVRGADGSTAGLRGMFVDVTQAKENEIALREAEERYRMLADHVIDLVSLHDADGRILYASPSLEEILGYMPEEVVGMPLSDFLHPEDLPDFQAAIGRKLAGEEQGAVVFRAFRKSGEMIWLETKGARVDGLGGREEPRLIGVTRDISDRQALQEELAHAQRLEALGRLAGGIAHDFNNILTVIRGRLDLLGDALARESGASHAGDLDEMDRAVDRAGALVRQLLTFGRRDRTRPRQIDLNETVRELAQMLRRLIPERVQIEEVLAGTPLQIEIDPSQLEQTLVNLAVNARDAIEGSGAVTLCTELRIVNETGLELARGVEPGNWVVLSVGDTGAGMDAQTLERIFEPFFTTRDVDGGTGLGLAIVYGVMKQARGHVLVHSRPGKGTTFELWFPASGLIEPEPTVGGTEAILLVAEDAHLRTTMLSVLESAGYRVTPTESALEALAAFLRNPAGVDLLVCDAVHSRGEGAELAERMRVDRPALAVVLVASRGQGGSPGAGGATPHTRILRHPFGSGQLAATVREALDERGNAMEGNQF